MTIDNLIDALTRLRSEGVGNVPVYSGDGSRVELIIPCTASGQGPEENYDDVAEVALVSVF